VVFTILFMRLDTQHLFSSSSLPFERDLHPIDRFQSVLPRLLVNFIHELPVDLNLKTTLSRGVDGLYLVKLPFRYALEKKSLTGRLRASDLFMPITVKALIDSAGLPPDPVLRFLDTLLMEVSTYFYSNLESFAVTDDKGTSQPKTLVMTIWGIRDEILANWAEETPKSAITVIEWLEKYRLFVHTNINEIGHLRPSEALLCKEVHLPIVYKMFNEKDALQNSLVTWADGLAVGVSWEDFLKIKARAALNAGVPVEA
jgi:hypothetical protein